MELLILIPVVWFVYRIVHTAIENDRIQKVARIEADLKLKLVEKLKDPELVLKVIESRLDSTASPQERVERKRPGRVEARAQVQLASSRPGRAPRMVLGGMIVFLTGIAFIICSQVEHREFDELLLPGLLSCAVGLSLLTFATSQKEIRRMVEDGGNEKVETGA